MYHRRGIERWIVCILVPDLPVQVEIRRQPKLKDRPFGIASTLAKSTGAIIACSPQGKEMGLQEGMSVREAMSLGEEITLLPADPDYYEEAHIDLVETLGQWAPAVEEGGLGCVYIDLTGMQRLYPHPKKILSKLQKAASNSRFRIRAMAGSGPNKFVAAVAARLSQGAALHVLPPDVAGFLAPCSIEHLPVAAKVKDRLMLLGLRTLGSIARIDPGAFIAQFGHEGRFIWELSRGIDGSPVIPRSSFRPIGEKLSFASPVTEWEPFWVGIQQLLSRVWRRKERKGATVRQLEITAFFEEARWEKRFTFSEPIGDLHRLKRVLSRRLDGVVLPGAVRELSLKLTRLGGSYVGQETLFSERAERRQRLRAAFEPLKARYGTTGLYRVTEVEPWSRIPERRYALISFDP